MSLGGRDIDSYDGRQKGKERGNERGREGKEKVKRDKIELLRGDVRGWASENERESAAAQRRNERSS